MLLKVLTIVLGAFVVIMRGSALLKPAFGRRMMQSFIDRKLWVNVMALVIAIYGAVLFWAARLHLATCELGPWDNWRVMLGDVIRENTTWAFIIGAWCAIGGLLMLIAPGLFAGIMKKFVDMSDAVLRAFLLIGVAVGLAILYLGICVY